MSVTAGELSHGVSHSGNQDLPLEYSTEEGSLKIFGFWLFLVQDLILFSCLFATYIVQQSHTAGGPTAAQLFDVPGFTTETFLLLTSSFTMGLATLSMRNGNVKRIIGWMIVTVILGLGFIGFEVTEFVTYASHGATMQRSGFLSAFFTLVGTHGAHVSLGIIWMVSIIIQLARRGLNPVNARKIFIVGLYWHFLDVVWVFIFTVVYLTGVL
ncbi:cytochrome aa3 quinol oxidase subunit III [Alicyclobacillus tolerans]|uniref:cytochrome aa3 quinol oxidase subunit III n=1 Tax=Alicyclobacillus tolerans TaxID=90970 RepID=UPI001F02151E|nr:cytochrome aa3 quinol oxidase subunit III [Alicyclobacillus tolerans]MCF8566457.1 cytochrome aa3 quinol oxidase subunit III [Alicyclobacillus tolerans]